MGPIPEQTAEPYITQESGAAVLSRHKEGRNVLMAILGSIAAMAILVIFVWLLLL